MKDKRGKGIPVNKNVRKAIKLLAKEIAMEKIPGTIPGICAACAIVKSSGSLCELHRQEEDKSKDAMSVWRVAANRRPFYP